VGAVPLREIFGNKLFRRQLMKKAVFFGLLAIALVFVLIGCDNGTTNYGETLVGTWTKTVEGEEEVHTLLLVVDDDTWVITVDGDYYAEGIWIEADFMIGFWYDEISETHPEPGYVYATYSLSGNGKYFTISGDAEDLLGGTDPWTRVN